MERDYKLWGKFSEGWRLRSSYGLLGGMSKTPAQIAEENRQKLFFKQMKEQKENEKKQLELE